MTRWTHRAVNNDPDATHLGPTHRAHVAPELGGCRGRRDTPSSTGWHTVPGDTAGCYPCGNCLRMLHLPAVLESTTVDELEASA